VGAGGTTPGPDLLDRSTRDIAGAFDEKRAADATPTAFPWEIRRAASARLCF